MSDSVKTKRNYAEWRGQEADWVFLQKALPQDACVYGIDQSGKRSRDANVRRHARGCLPGPGDFYILWRGITVWPEKKTPTGAQSESQKVFQSKIEANDGHYVLYVTMAELEAGIVRAGIPLRATLGEIRQRIDEQNERLPVKRKRGARKAGAPINSMSLAQYRRLNERGLV